MTNVDKLVMQMEYGADSRRRLALELVKLRAVASACRAQLRRLPHQVQTALRLEAQEYDTDAPAIGAPDLFHQEKTA